MCFFCAGVHTEYENKFQAAYGYSEYWRSATFVRQQQRYEQVSLLKVWENIAFALEVKGVSKVQRRKRADELLEMIALADQGDKMVSELSGGQKQRVAVVGLRYT